MRDSPISDLYLYRYCCAQLEYTSPRSFIGSVYGHIRTLSFLKQNIEHVFQSANIVELMVHPGLYLPISHTTWFSNLQRLGELLNLIRLRKHLDRWGVQIVNQDGVKC